MPKKKKPREGLVRSFNMEQPYKYSKKHMASKLKPHKGAIIMSIEDLEDYVKELNVKTAKEFKHSSNRLNSVRYYSEPIYSPKDIKPVCDKFVTEVLDHLKNIKDVSIVTEWKLWETDCTFYCPHTFGLLDKPREGYWVLTGSFKSPYLS